MTSLVEFKACAFHEMQDELIMIQKKIYKNLKEFQAVATQFLMYLENIKDKKKWCCMESNL
jgi:hypothetical protein